MITKHEITDDGRGETRYRYWVVKDGKRQICHCDVEADADRILDAFKRLSEFEDVCKKILKESIEDGAWIEYPPDDPDVIALINLVNKNTPKGGA